MRVTALAICYRPHQVCATSLFIASFRMTLHYYWMSLFQNDMSLLSVDGYSMDGVSHKEAVTIIRRSYMDKKNPILKLVLLNN